MKAIGWTVYGKPDVLKLIDIEKPAPKNNEVLIRVRATAVTTGDCRLRALKVPFGMRLLTRLALGITKPRKLIPGMNFSGEVECIGIKVSQFKEGDRVFGSTGMRLGANAEYICIEENNAIIQIPDSLSYKNAVSLIFGGLTAIHFLRDKVKIKNDDQILINGASGSVGTASIQIAKYYGAYVTGICSSKNHELAKSLGADYMIDYTKEEFYKNGKSYDVILDTVGNLSFSTCQKSLTKSGKAVLISTGLGAILQSLFNKRLVCGVAGDSKESLRFLIELVNSGKLKPVIDNVYPLEEAAEAHRYVDKGHKKGNVILTTIN
ncbi:MAG: NAD(P)-dependent alcohol dehydrogenase [Methylococcaceae bacterium]